MLYITWFLLIDSLVLLPEEGRRYTFGSPLAYSMGLSQDVKSAHLLAVDAQMLIPNKMKLHPA